MPILYCVECGKLTTEAEAESRVIATGRCWRVVAVEVTKASVIATAFSATLCGGRLLKWAPVTTC